MQLTILIIDKMENGNVKNERIDDLNKNKIYCGIDILLYILYYIPFFSFSFLPFKIKHAFLKVSIYNSIDGKINDIR